MQPALRNRKTGNIFLRMHPLQRLLMSLGMSLLVFLIINNKSMPALLILVILWDVFAFTFIITSWIVFFTRPVPEIIKQANQDDGSKLFVMISILVSSFASMFTVLLLMISKDQPAGLELITVITALTGMVVSWIMVHTIFAFHYAHLYYFKNEDANNSTALIFPDEKKPDYLDFAYFSFVIGMTFQVSDIEVSSRKIRRTVLTHGLLSFALNTFVVALTINLIAGLKK